MKKVFTQLRGMSNIAANVPSLGRSVLVELINFKQMEIYIKDKDGKLQETTLFNLLNKAFKKAGFKLENGSWNDENHNWIGVVQESKKPAQVTTNITFENNGNTITGLKVYVAPIKRVVDEDNSEQVV